MRVHGSVCLFGTRKPLRTRRRSAYLQTAAAAARLRVRVSGVFAIRSSSTCAGAKTRSGPLG